MDQNANPSTFLDPNASLHLILRILVNKGRLHHVYTFFHRKYDMTPLFILHRDRVIKFKMAVHTMNIHDGDVYIYITSC